MMNDKDYIALLEQVLTNFRRLIGEQDLGEYVPEADWDIAYWAEHHSGECPAFAATEDDYAEWNNV